MIRLTVLMYVNYGLSLRGTKDLLFQRGIGICHETVRVWIDRFGPMFLGETHHLWRAVDHEGEVLEWYCRPKWSAASFSDARPQIGGGSRRVLKAARARRGDRRHFFVPSRPMKRKFRLARPLG